MSLGNKVDPTAGIKPYKKFQIRWNEPLGDPDGSCPYMYRSVLLLGGFGIRLHRWIRSDDKRAMHNHPWAFCTLVLSGSYTDVSCGPSGDRAVDHLHTGCFRFRSAEHTHYVEVPEGGCWTLLLTGRPLQRPWRFYKDGKWIPRFKYFKRYGHPPCDEQ